jgi:UPF0716 protein FxsA|tara:strand:+ start:19 stop:435 length:417 start_codon:yes stop_codon:yes gene_type:complete
MNTILISIIALPIIEILLFIKVGERIGAINTILLIIFTAVVGVFFARIQGIRTLKSGFINLYHNKLPVYELFSGASIAIAAVFLIIPGFFTDALGFLLLIPTTRKLLLSIIIKKKQSQKNDDDKIIEAEIIDEKKDEL